MVESIKCDKCGKAVGPGFIKLDLIKQEYICLDCYKGIQTKKEPKQVERVKDRPLGNKVTRDCPHCHYKYRFDQNTGFPFTCPYCNKKESDYVGI